MSWVNIYALIMQVVFRVGLTISVSQENVCGRHSGGGESGSNSEYPRIQQL